MTHPTNWAGKADEKEQTLFLNFVSHDSVDLYETEIVDGRNFSREFLSDDKGAFLLNQTAVRAIGWESAIGKELTHYIGRRTRKVVGVVKDFHMNPFHQPIEPLCLDLNYPTADPYLSVRVN